MLQGFQNCIQIHPPTCTQARKYPKGGYFLDENNSKTSKTIHCVAEPCAAAGAKIREDDDNDNDIKTTRQISSQKTHARML